MSALDLPDQLIFKGNGGTYPPHGIITASDHGPVVVTFNWIMFSLTGLAVIARCSTRRTPSVDAFCIIAAFLLLALQSAAVHVAASHGLGRHLKDLSPSQYDLYSKSFYISQILQIIILMLSKISYLFVYIRIVTGSSTAMKGMRALFLGSIVFIVTWAVASALSLAFQCPMPTPWNSLSGACVNQAALYYSIGVLNAVTDLAIVIMPALIVYNLQIRRSERFKICLIFATRILTIAATIVQLCVLGQYLFSNDQTWLSTVPTIWSQVMVNLSVITACIPLVKPFLDVLQFSLVDTSALPFSVQAGLYAETHGNRSYPWSKDSKSSKSSKEKTSDRQKSEASEHHWRRGRDSYSLGLPRL